MHGNSTFAYHKNAKFIWPRLVNLIKDARRIFLYIQYFKNAPFSPCTLVKNSVSSFFSSKFRKCRASQVGLLSRPMVALKRALYFQDRPYPTHTLDMISFQSKMFLQHKRIKAGFSFYNDTEKEWATPVAHSFL